MKIVYLAKGKLYLPEEGKAPTTISPGKCPTGEKHES
jgi:hypothetical protein